MLRRGSLLAAVRRTGREELVWRVLLLMPVVSPVGCCLLLGRWRVVDAVLTPEQRHRTVTSSGYRRVGVDEEERCPGSARAIQLWPCGPRGM
jgi:hypothetical protein